MLRKIFYIYIELGYANVCSNCSNVLISFFLIKFQRIGKFFVNLSLITEMWSKYADCALLIKYFPLKFSSLDIALNNQVPHEICHANKNELTF